jgi:hypothetical protein
MALKALDLNTVKAMDAERRTAYFEKYAGYFPENPRLRYAIRVGSKTLFSNDTLELRLKFDHFLDNAT